MTTNSKDLLVGEGNKVKLRKRPTKIAPMYQSKNQYQTFFGEHVAQLSAQQQLLYASNR